MKKAIALIMMILLLTSTVISLTACTEETCQGIANKTFGYRCTKTATWKGTNGLTTVYTCDEHKKDFDGEGREWKRIGFGLGF